MEIGQNLMSFFHCNLNTNTMNGTKQRSIRKAAAACLPASAKYYLQSYFWTSAFHQVIVRQRSQFCPRRLFARANKKNQSLPPLNARVDPAPPESELTKIKRDLIH